MLFGQIPSFRHDEEAQGEEVVGPVMHCEVLNPGVVIGSQAGPHQRTYIRRNFCWGEHFDMRVDEVHLSKISMSGQLADHMGRPVPAQDSLGLSSGSGVN
ncbi:hypothetical protein ACFYY2_04870 [Streptomyces sp. NPDC001822]|uniref:hypothetical protein n=1 Tax=Streptomyces sp. NPDC001822 TaxID=3364614 RepID=UPI00368131B6